MRAVLAFFLILMAACPAAIIPASRMGTYTPGVTIGVPGGIPTNRTQFVNVLTTGNSTYLCHGDGVTDDTAALQAACRACPSGQYVYCPTATYKLANRVLVQTTDNWTLKGDGMGLTVFKLTSSLGFEIGTQQNPQPTTGLLAITAGATTGSTALTVASTSTVNVGNLIYVTCTTPSWMHTLNFFGVANWVCHQTFKVVSKTGTVVTITPPMAFDVSTYSPQIIPWGNGGGGRLTQGVGMEDFTIDANSVGTFPFKMQQVWGCWLKGVEITDTLSRQMFFLTTCASEIRRCYTHNTIGSGPSHEGIDFVNDSCWNWIEDDICVDGGKPSIIFGDAQGGCVGNMVSYCYVENDPGTTGDVFNAGISDSHGAGGNAFNGYEGNVCTGFQSDGYYGGSSYGTLFRNFFSNDNLSQGACVNNGPTSILLNHYAVYYNLVGNVLGSTLMPAQLYDWETNDGYKQLVYRLGFPNPGTGAYSGTITATTPPDYSAEPAFLAAPGQHFTANASTDVITITGSVFTQAINGFVVNNPFVLTSTGTLPGGLVSGTTYYIRSIPSISTITLSATPSGGLLDITDAGIGTHSWTPAVPLTTKLDFNVKNTIIRHGNYDYKTLTTIWETDDSRGTGVDFVDHTIPNSILYGSTPSWWINGLAWPPIGPDLTPKIGLIPAQVRYTGGIITPTDPGAAVVPRLSGIGKRFRR